MLPAIITHADDSRESKAFIRVCMSVCPVHTIEPKRLKLQSPNLPSWVMAIHLMLGQKVKGQGHRLTKCKNIFQAIEWPAWVGTLSSTQRLVLQNVMRAVIAWWPYASCYNTLHSVVSSACFVVVNVELRSSMSLSAVSSNIQLHENINTVVVYLPHGAEVLVGSFQAGHRQSIRILAI